MKETDAGFIRGRRERTGVTHAGAVVSVAGAMSGARVEGMTITPWTTPSILARTGGASIYKGAYAMTGAWEVYGSAMRTFYGAGVGPYRRVRRFTGADGEISQRRFRRKKTGQT